MFELTSHPAAGKVFDTPRIDFPLSAVTGEREEDEERREEPRSEAGPWRWREGGGYFGTVAIVIPRKFLPVKCIITLIIIIIIITKIS